VRDIETINGELRLVAALRRAARERGGPLPSVAVADALLDERRLASRKTQSSSLGSAIMVTTASSGKSTVYAPSGRSDVSLIFGGSPAPLLWMSLIPSMTKVVGGTPSMPDGKSSSKPICTSSMRLSVVA